MAMSQLMMFAAKSSMAVHLSPLPNLKICVTSFIAETFSSSSLSQSLKGQRFIQADNL
jgi:hypothetical protein